MAEALSRRKSQACGRVQDRLTRDVGRRRRIRCGCIQGLVMRCGPGAGEADAAESAVDHADDETSTHRPSDQSAQAACSRLAGLRTCPWEWTMRLDPLVRRWSLRWPESHDLRLGGILSSLGRGRRVKSRPCRQRRLRNRVIARMNAPGFRLQQRRFDRVNGLLGLANMAGDL